MYARLTCHWYITDGDGDADGVADTLDVPVTLREAV
jgi:hypothetical protein